VLIWIWIGIGIEHFYHPRVGVKFYHCDGRISELGKGISKVFCVEVPRLPHFAKQVELECNILAGSVLVGQHVMTLDFGRVNLEV